MPSVSLSTSKPATAAADALVLGIRSADDHDGVHPGLADTLELLGFTGDKGQLVSFPSNGAVKAKVVVAVALPSEPTAEDLRRAAGRAVRSLTNAKSAAFALHPASVEEVAAIAEGIGLAAYEFKRYKSAPKGQDKKGLETATVLSAFARQKTAASAVDDAATVVEAVNAARDWVNTPPGDLRPADFATSIGEHAGSDVKIQVWDEKRLEKEKCGGLLGVGRGSEAPPRLVRLTYSPSGAKQHLALVGKGITFDSGGLSIKPGASMQTMKCDMAGAAAVVAAIVAIARLGLPVKVTAFACLAENMPSGSATRPGDVLTIRGGTTVEVHNTDAEGRLVLADGLVLAGEAKPDRIVDVATLTGAAVVALGNFTSGVLGNDDDFADDVVDASKRAGESMWRLPITEEMKGLVTSSQLADVRQHNPKPAGGTLYAAAFLREFVDADTPWAHLDIAGPAFNEAGASDYTPSGGTGTAVRTLVELARTL